ncbi:hypothetical protein Taro_049625 [Colocasia esculenta]|uniref:Uncharacterized protein n=1 Tax=Colocasia esculenta TaxID=4460 RepID=A0A843XBD2_COLES|nr:hypothetical protein [Colocasia esculenta]
MRLSKSAIAGGRVDPTQKPFPSLCPLPKKPVTWFPCTVTRFPFTPSLRLTGSIEKIMLDDIKFLMKMQNLLKTSYTMTLQIMN